jgi:SnoaL-like domain
MTPDQWIERYRRARETADADEVVALFTPGASYQSRVFREPYVGSDAIRQYWQRSRNPARCHRPYGTARRYRRPRCGGVVDDDDRP